MSTKDEAMEAYTGTPDPFESLNGLQIVVLVFTFLLMVMSTLVIYYGEAHTTKFGKLNILMEKTIWISSLGVRLHTCNVL